MVAVSEQCECPRKLPADVLSFCDEVEVCCACGEAGLKLFCCFHYCSAQLVNIRGLYSRDNKGLFMCVAILSNCPHAMMVPYKGPRIINRLVSAH